MQAEVLTQPLAPIGFDPTPLEAGLWVQSVARTRQRPLSWMRPTAQCPSSLMSKARTITSNRVALARPALGCRSLLDLPAGDEVEIGASLEKPFDRSLLCLGYERAEFEVGRRWTDSKVLIPAGHLRDDLVENRALDKYA